MNDMIFDSLIVQPFYFIRKDNFDRDMKIACTLIQKSYAVNLFWVKEIYKEELLLRNGVTLKIGKKYQQDVLASYKEYLLK